MKVHLNFTFHILSLILGSFLALNEIHAFSVNGESKEGYRVNSTATALALNLNQKEEDYPTVTLPLLGIVQGGINSTFPLLSASTRQFYFFDGIPYAEPESYTKQNRFKPSEIWASQLPIGETGGFLATDHSIKCPQSGSEQNEECLVLNINTPILPQGGNIEPLPVIVFLHGGGFDSGWSGLYRGHRILKENVVFVSINYRLGLLGSLNLGTTDAPGNAALYDVITALKWIKTYIQYFGGDKDKITVTGHSAGAVLATHLLTTELDIDDNNGLPSIQGIIGLSGSSLSQNLATCTDPLTQHLQVSQIAGCHDEADNPNLIRNCLVEKTAGELLDAMNKYTSSEISEGRFGLDAKLPSLQSKSIQKAFMTETPFQVLSAGRQKLNIPVMMGATRHDGSYLVEQMLEKFWRPNNYVQDPLFMRNDMLPALMNAFGLKDDSMEFTHALEYLYIGEDAMNTDDFESKIPGLIDIFSVLGFKAGAYNLVELNAKKNPNSYYFSFEYRGFCTMDNGGAIPGGIGHTDSLFYLFQTDACLMVLPWDISFSNQFIKYWVNFATYGNPNGSGKKTIVAPYNSLNHAYVILDGFDRTAYYARDKWVNNALELIAEETSPTTFTPTSETGPVTGPEITEPEDNTDGPNPTTNEEIPGTGTSSSSTPTTSSTSTEPGNNNTAATVTLNAVLLCLLLFALVQY